MSQFNEVLDKIKEFGNQELAEFFQKKVSGARHFIALFHLESEKKLLEGALKGDKASMHQTKKSYILKTDEIVLDFEDKQMIGL